MKSLNELSSTQVELASNTFHIRLLKYVEFSTTEEEYNELNDETVMFFEMEDGRYTISFNELKVKADEETLIFLENNKIEFKDLNKTQDEREENNND